MSHSGLECVSLTAPFVSAARLTRGEPGNSHPIIAQRRETVTAERKSSKKWSLRAENVAKEECEGKRGKHFICCSGVLNTKYIQDIRSRNKTDNLDIRHPEPQAYDKQFQNWCTIWS